jgi:hypothetical protein
VRLYRASLNYWADVVAFLFGAIVLATGLLLLIRFHAGEGIMRLSAFGVSRLGWVNLHRLSAIPVLVAVTVHTFLHWRAITTRVGRAWGNLPGKAGPADLILYFGFALTVLAGFAAWSILPGSPPLLEAIRPQHLQPVRHICIDIHNVSGLVLLPAVIIHVRRHLGWLLHPHGIEQRSAVQRVS